MNLRAVGQTNGYHTNV